MKNPYYLLDLPEECDDQSVKKAYLQKVKRYPPEQHPERFQEIRTAFESIQTHRDRVAFQLFRTPEPDIPRLFEPLFKKAISGTPSKSDLLQVLADGVEKCQLSHQS